MRKMLIGSALAIATAAGAGYAAAADDRLGVNVPKEQWMSIAQIAEKLASQGYDIREIEIDDGAYEVSAIKDGKRVKAYLHPGTGEVLRTKTRNR
ncbi:MAG: PepSY domain-containing protein [Hyphomicrobiaceae bacterium]|nr:PepSY domain-containing protein [Hyphomicrobiaceae bacterium]